MKKTLVLLLIMLAPTSVMAQKEEPWVTIDLPKIDFGFVPQYGTSYHRFWIKSKIDDTLKIGESKTFCDCLEFTFEDSILAPKDSIPGMVALSSDKLVGKKHWVPAIFTREPRARIARIDVTAVVFGDPAALNPIRVEPMVVNASWFGDKGPQEYLTTIANFADETIPLRLIETDTTYFSLEFPVFLEPGQKKEIKIVLNKRGLTEDFQESITFEYIDNVTSERKHYTIPIKRRIFKSPN